MFVTRVNVWLYYAVNRTVSQRANHICQENRNCVSVFKDFGSLIDNDIFFQALPSFFLNNENCYLTHTLALHLFRLLSMR